MGKNTANNLNVYLAISLHTSLTFNKKNVQNCYKFKKMRRFADFWVLIETGSIKGG